MLWQCTPDTPLRRIRRLRQGLNCLQGRLQSLWLSTQGPPDQARLLLHPHPEPGPVPAGSSSHLTPGRGALDTLPGPTRAASSTQNVFSTVLPFRTPAYPLGLNSNTPSPCEALLDTGTRSIPPLWASMSCAEIARLPPPTKAFVPQRQEPCLIHLCSSGNKHSVLNQEDLPSRVPSTSEFESIADTEYLTSRKASDKECKEFPHVPSREIQLNANHLDTSATDEKPSQRVLIRYPKRKNKGQAGLCQG